jgi:hypothetical protein
MTLCYKTMAFPINNPPEIWDKLKIITVDYLR